MLPPIDSSILENNPQFANLYKGLTELLLNEDGSTKLPPNSPAAQERKAVSNKLSKHRLKAAEETLLIHALSTTSPDPVPVPISQEQSKQPYQRSPIVPGGLNIQRRFETSKLRQIQPPPPPTVPANLKQPLTGLLLLLPSFLSLDFSSSGAETPLDMESLTLILTSPPISQLPSLLPYLGPLLSTTLHSRALELAHIVRLSDPSITNSHPTTTTTNRPIPQLPTKISTLITDTLPKQRSLYLRSRLTTPEELRDLLAKYTTTLSLLIKTLEAKHGPIARSLEFKASETALLAQKAEKESELALLGVKRDVYTGEVRRALIDGVNWLVDGKRRVEEEIEKGREMLREYGVGTKEGEGDKEQERIMREIARVYGEMEREVDVVRRDLERLGGGGL